MTHDMSGICHPPGPPRPLPALCVLGAHVLLLLLLLASPEHPGSMQARAGKLARAAPPAAPIEAATAVWVRLLPPAIDRSAAVVPTQPASPAVGGAEAVAAPAPSATAALALAPPPPALYEARPDHAECPPAPYPALLRERGVEGVVRVRVRGNAAIEGWVDFPVRFALVG